MAFRQFLEKNAKKESFRSLILEESDISSSQDKKPLKEETKRKNKDRNRIKTRPNSVEAQDLNQPGSDSSLVFGNPKIGSPFKKSGKLPPIPIYEKKEDVTPQSP
jgi:hypothetical protein